MKKPDFVTLVQSFTYEAYGASHTMPKGHRVSVAFWNRGGNPEFSCGHGVYVEIPAIHWEAPGVLVLQQEFDDFGIPMFVVESLEEAKKAVQEIFRREGRFKVEFDGTDTWTSPGCTWWYRLREVPHFSKAKLK